MQSNLINHIQILRGLSVLLVVLYHYFPFYIPYGYVGVDIFFVISGYVITKSLVSKIERGQPFISSFYRHRLFRIAPAYMLVTASVLLFSCLALLPEDARNVAKHAAGSAVFLNNLILFFEVGYFDVGGELKPLLHYWSLSVEEQFYVIYPVILALIIRRSRNKRYQLVSLVTLSVLSFCAFAIINESQSSLAFYSMPTRFWELALGGCAFLAGKGSQNSGNGAHTILAMLLILLVLSLLPSELNILCSLIAIVMALVFISYTSCDLAISGISKSILNPFFALGTLSYSLYLTHWPLYSLARILIQADPSVGVKVLLIMISVAVSYLIYRFVEVPLVALGRKESKARFISKEVSIISMLLVLLFSSSAYIYSSKIFELRALADTKKFTEAGYWKHAYIRCDKDSNKKFNLDPSCVSGGATAQKGFAILGDSHADQYFIGLSESGAKYGYSGYHLGANGCPPLIGVNRVERPGCSLYLEGAINQIENNQHINIVFIAARWAYYAQGITSAGEPVGIASFLDHNGAKIENKKAVAYGLENIIRRLLGHGKTVIVIDQIPEFSIDPRKYEFYTDRELFVNKENFIKRRAGVVESVVGSLLSYSKGNLFYFDPVGLFCNGSSCTSKINGDLYYRDDDHLNLMGSKYVSQVELEKYFRGQGSEGK